MDPEAEKRRRERRLKESKEGKEGKSSSKSKAAARKLDIIDKLDVTSIYGTGREFFDNCIGKPRLKIFSVPP